MTDVLLYKRDQSCKYTRALLAPVCEQMDTEISSAQRAKAQGVRSKLFPRARRQYNAPGASEDHVDGNNQIELVFEEADSPNFKSKVQQRKL